MQAFISAESSGRGAFRVSGGPGLLQQAVQDDGSTMPAPQTELCRDPAVSASDRSVVGMPTQTAH